MDSLSVIFEDTDLLAIDKPDGIATIPERIEREHCLTSVIEKQRGFRPFVVHRLDKEVSGVILFAKNAEAHRNLCMQFEHRQTCKLYAALVHGSPPEDHGTVNAPLRQFGSGRMGVDSRKGKPCTTEFDVSERLTGYTLLSVHPLTGRRHQIRVHLYSLGHAIVGDMRYGEHEAQARFARLMLHASRLEFRLPGGEQKTIESPLPASFAEIVAALMTAA